MDSIVKLLSRLLSCVLGWKFWKWGHQVNLLLKQKGTQEDAVVWGIPVSHTPSAFWRFSHGTSLWRRCLQLLGLGPGSVGWSGRCQDGWNSPPRLDCSLPPKVHHNGFLGALSPLGYINIYIYIIFFKILQIYHIIIYFLNLYKVVKKGASLYAATCWKRWFINDSMPDFRVWRGIPSPN